MDTIAFHMELSTAGLFTSDSTVFLLSAARISDYHHDSFILQKIIQDIDGFSAIPIFFLLTIASLLISCMTLAFMLLTLLKNRKLYHTHSEDQYPFTDEPDLSDGPTLTVVEGTRRSD